MPGDRSGVKMGVKEYKLVKWDGDAPQGGIPEDAKDFPEKYPQVAEVIRGGDGIPTTVIYRRS